MIVVDTSAIVAILFHEPEREAFRGLLEEGRAVVSAGTLIETLRVVGRRRPELRHRVRDVIATNAIDVIPVDRDQVDLAEDGMLRFGIGRGAPPAVLNFGDLFAYALARKLGAPLLFKGNDFGRTDVRAAAP